MGWKKKDSRNINFDVNENGSQCVRSTISEICLCVDIAYLKTRANIICVPSPPPTMTMPEKNVQKSCSSERKPEKKKNTKWTTASGEEKHTHGILSI